MFKATREFKTCVNCVMDSSDQLIKFDERGVCDHCNTFYMNILPNWRHGKFGFGSLDRVVDEIKYRGKNSEFDCIIGMSGGVDSSYLTYIAVEMLGLRPLVFHVDGGWNSQIAVNNIDKMVSGLGLDLVTEVIDWEEMADLQLAFFKSGLANIDAPQDHAFFATMYRFAAKHNVKTILTGGNYSTECIRNPVEWMYYQSDDRLLRDVHRKFGEKQLKSFPTTSVIWHKIWLPYVRGIRTIRMLDSVSFIKDDAKKLLQSRFGWTPYPRKHFESRFTSFYESYWLYERFGYDVRKVQLSSLIVTGQMAREVAIKELENSPYDQSEVNRELEFISNKLDVTVDELHSYMSLPKKTYRDFRNNAWLYNFGASASKALGLERGGKR